MEQGLRLRGHGQWEKAQREGRRKVKEITDAYVEHEGVWWPTRLGPSLLPSLVSFSILVMAVRVAAFPSVVYLVLNVA